MLSIPHSGLVDTTTCPQGISAASSEREEDPGQEMPAQCFMLIAWLAGRKTAVRAEMPAGLGSSSHTQFLALLETSQVLYAPTFWNV